MWLTASTWLPAELLTALSAVSGPGDSGVPPAAAGFCQGGPLDQLAPGPVLTTFLADASGVGTGTIGTGTAVAGGTGHPAADHADRPIADHAEGPFGSADGPFRSLAGRSDHELIGLIRGWRKSASLAAAAELAAVAELTARRHAEAKQAGEWDSTAMDAADDEIAAALTLTPRATGALIDRATALRHLPATFAALAVGHIDMPKALVIITGLAGQAPALAAAIEAQVIGRAPAQTTGQLRAALNRALLAADPAAAERRRQAEERRARIERSPEPGGCTATLAGRNLPVTATIAAWNRITQLARQLKANGVPGTLDELRVRVYLALLSGQAAAPPTPQPATVGASTTDVASGSHPSEPTDEAGPHGPGHDAAARDSISPDEPNPGAAGPDTAADTGARATGSPDAPPKDATGSISGATAADPVTAIPVTAGSASAGPGGLIGTINLTIPLTTLLQLTDSPGELGGFGPITAHAAREIAAATLGASAVRWCVTVTGDNGQAIGHGCASRTRAALADTTSRSRAAPGPSIWAFTIKISALAGTDCAHSRESANYRPPPSLWHLIQIRNQHCTAPGCRMPAAKCDDDHTLAYEKCGRTCECNLGPLCRHHHRVKQSQGWRLEQPEPGIFAWVTPSGWAYITGPENYTR